MPKCDNCGTDNLEQAKFCKHCGLTLSLTSTSLDAAELLSSLQRTKEEAERKVPQLQAELDAKGRELSAALEKGASLERELASAKAPQGSVEAGHHTIHDALQKLTVERDDLSGALADAATRIKDLEHRLGANLGTVKTVVARRRWVTPTLSGALALVTSIAGVGYWRGGTAPIDVTRETQALRDGLAAAKQTESRLQEEIATLRKSPPPAAATDSQAAAALAARESTVRRSEEANTKRSADLDAKARTLKDAEQQLAGENRRIADERKALETARKDVKSPPRAPPNPAAPFGFLLWQGRVQAATDVFISGSQASGGGEVFGTLPGRKCDVRIEKIGARVKIEPEPNNNWNQAVISPEPGRLATVLFAWTCQGR
jgi:hypothetical protein